MKDYEDTCERRFFSWLPLSHKYDPTDLYNKYSALLKDVVVQIPSMHLYPSYRDTCQYFKISEVKLDLIAAYKHEECYRFYMAPGWDLTLEARHKKIAECRAMTAKDLSICKEKLYENSFKITSKFAKLFEKCSRKHFSRWTYYDYALLAYTNNNWDKSIELLLKITEEGGGLEVEANLPASELYQVLGSSCIELMAYDKAIEYLSEAIKKDPGNKKAYFERATAYFETGDFDSSLKDYLSSDKGKEIFQSNFEATKNFTRALVKNVCIGAAESAIDFVPSLCNTAHGLGSALWTTAKQPLESTKYFANACYEMSECLLDYFKNVDWDTLDGYTEEIKTLYDQFHQLNDVEKGRLIGYTIGKYGTDIFVGGTVFKGIVACKKIKIANTVCNLEAMTLSAANKEKIVVSSMRHAAERDAYFKNVKIHWDRQNKHIPGKHNYEHGKGIILLEPVELETLVKNHVGKGQRVIGEFGEAGYVERVDFGKIIGEYALKEEGKPVQFILTSKGTIKFAQNGKVHVVPSAPKEFIK